MNTGGAVAARSLQCDTGGDRAARAARGRGIMSDGFEFPDEAGYPDGEGVLHEGTDDAASAVEGELEEFADGDEEDESN